MDSAWKYIFQNTSRCDVCPGNKRCVKGDGDINAKLFFIGEAPGRDEDENSGRPFTGKAGYEFNSHYLPLAGLDRDEIYLTNTRKCRPPNNKKPTPNEITVCGSHFLPRELEVLNPELVVLMGSTACSLVDNVDLETHHGIPLSRELFGKEYVVIPTYHPALGLHDGSKIGVIRSDFEGIKRYLRSNWTGPVDRLEGKEQYEVLAPGNWKRYLDSSLVSLDTEGDIWSWQVSIKEGTGLFGLTDRDSLKILEQILKSANSIAIHHALHDVPVITRAGLSVDWSKVIDTMQRAYRLQIPQGLKPLAFRYLGMKMQNYMDLVRPACMDKMRGWLIECESLLKDSEEITYSKVKKVPKTVTVKHPYRTALNRIIRHCHNEYDPWSRVNDIMSNDSAGLLDQIIETIGPPPSLHLSEIDFGRAKFYATRDADAGLRLEHKLRSMEDNYWPAYRKEPLTKQYV